MANILRSVPKPVYCQKGQSTAPYYGLVLYSQTIAASISRSCGFSPPTLDHFIAHLFAHTRAPCAAGVAALVLMDAVRFHPLPSCASSLHLRFFACLRVVLEHIYRRVQPPNTWASCQPLADLHQCTKINSELLQALRLSLVPADAHKLTAITSHHQSPDFIFEPSLDGKTYTIRQKLLPDSPSVCSDASSFLSTSEENSSHWSDDEDDASDDDHHHPSQPPNKKTTILRRCIKALRPSLS